jgi:hypothetical protein
MTEAEWPAATEPGPMLVAVRGRASGRKLRLFACVLPPPLALAGRPGPVSLGDG